VVRVVKSCLWRLVPCAGIDVSPQVEDHLDPKHYDIVIDTTSLSPDETFKRVVDELRAKLV